MTIRGQLASSTQTPESFPSFLIFYGPVEVGVLGNVAVQTVAKSVGVGQFSREAGFVSVAALAPSLHESAEMGWLVQNAQQLARYKGEWLLIRGAQLVVHSRDFAAVREAVRRQQIASPFVYYVPRDDESNSVTI